MAQSPEDMSEVLPESDSGVLVFKAGGQRLALPLSDVVEIIRPITITRVPHSPPELLGVANFRGTAVPIVSANLLLDAGPQTTPSTARIVMVKRKAIIGLMVEEVSTLAATSDANLIDLDALLAKNLQFQVRRDRKFETTLAPRNIPDEDPRHELVSILAFVLAHQEFALAIEQIEGIALLPPSIARVPRTDSAMLGAAEIDGALVPLISLHYLLGFQLADLDEKASRVILVRLGEALVGIVVDGVKEILRISREALDPVPSVLTRARGEAQIEAICRLDRGRRLISILAPTKLFDAETVARVVAEAEVGSMHMTAAEENVIDGEQFIIFQLGNESYGLPIGSVDEVVRCPENLTRVPIAPAFVRGLMNLRGKAVPVIDQNQRFSAEGNSEGVRKRIVVVTVEGLKAGFLVDNVSEVLTVPTTELSPAPELATDAASVIDRVAMIERDGHMILLIDPKGLLDRAERDVLEGISTNAEAPRGL
jgi:purine-binding chemotaxis protein CheW